MEAMKNRITYAIAQNLSHHDVRVSSEITDELKILIRERRYMDVATNLNMVKPFTLVFPIDVLNAIRSMKSYEDGLSFQKIITFIKLNLSATNEDTSNLQIILISTATYK